jgi:hypothetical protein
VTETIDYDLIRQSIDAGSAVCLLGAGFSVLAQQADSNACVPDTASLTNCIKEVLEIPADVQLSLADAAELAQEEASSRNTLNTLLIRLLTSTRPSAEQEWFIRNNWRAIFTTNFDDVIEVASRGLNRVPVTPASKPTSVPANRTPIYYLHGRALDLRERDTDPSLVIAESNYLRMATRNRELYARLFNEIICARTVIITGYSLRDLEIASQFLGNSEALRNKTYIVTASDENAISRRRLQKFGTIVATGIDGFCQSLQSAVHIGPQASAYQYLEKVHLTVRQDAQEPLSGDDFLATVLTGRIHAERYALQDISKENPYCVDRVQAIETVINGTQQRYIASGDFGNGKTAFLTQLAVRLFAKGYSVFSVETKLPELFLEIDRALALNGPVAFLIDDVIRYRNVASYIGNRLHAQALLVCTTRGDQDAQYERLAGELGGAHRFIDLNKLNDLEIDDWNQLLERWGYWELKASLSEEERRSYLIDRCGRENRSIIVSLFDRSHVAEKIDAIVNFFLKTKPEHTKAFCGLLISSLAQQHVSWESLVVWLEIDEEALRRDLLRDEVSFLFSRGRHWNFLTSAQLAEHILKNKFVNYERDVLVDVYAKIVLSTAESADDDRSGYDFRENLKELMKFKFLEKLFGESDDSGILIGRVYKRLSEARRIRGNPQFWLQYAMSRMNVRDLENAESFINTALGRASERGMDYDPYQILDQRARLYFMKNADASKPVSRSEILKALADLQELAKAQSTDIVYTMRSLPLIEEFLEERIDDVEAQIRDKIEDFITLIKEKSAGYDRLPRSQRGETSVLRKSLSNIEIILFNA